MIFLALHWAWWTAIVLGAILFAIAIGWAILELIFKLLKQGSNNIKHIK